MHHQLNAAFAVIGALVLLLGFFSSFLRNHSLISEPLIALRFPRSYVFRNWKPLVKFYGTRFLGPRALQKALKAFCGVDDRRFWKRGL